MVAFSADPSITYSTTLAQGNAVIAAIAGEVTTEAANVTLTTPVTPASYFITKAGVCAIILPTPAVGAAADDGTELEFVSTTAYAHTVTCTSLLLNGSTNVSTATFAAHAGASLVVRAYQGAWYVVAATNITFS